MANAKGDCPAISSIGRSVEPLEQYQEARDSLPDEPQVSQIPDAIRKSDYVLDLKPDSLEYLQATLSFMRDKLNTCSTSFKHMKCNSCNKEFSGPALFSCGLTYCWECRVTRTKKIYKRLMSKDIKSSRLMHLVMGTIPVRLSDFGKSDIKGIRSQFSAFVKEVSKHGYYLKGEYAVDFSVKGDYVFVHLHAGVLPFKGSDRCATAFNRAIEKVTKGEVKVVKLFGYRTKSSIFYYLAKRASGVLGHFEDFSKSDDSGEYGFKDFLSLHDWYRTLYRHRGITEFGFPGGVGSTIAPVDECQCPFCGSSDVVQIGVMTKNRKVTISQSVLDGGGGLPC